MGDTNPISPGLDNQAACLGAASTNKWQPYTCQGAADWWAAQERRHSALIPNGESISHSLMKVEGSYLATSSR